MLKKGARGPNENPGDPRKHKKKYMCSGSAPKKAAGIMHGRGRDPSKRIICSEELSITKAFIQQHTKCRQNCFQNCARIYKHAALDASSRSSKKSNCAKNLIHGVSPLRGFRILACIWTGILAPLHSKTSPHSPKTSPNHEFSSFVYF